MGRAASGGTPGLRAGRKKKNQVAPGGLESPGTQSPGIWRPEGLGILNAGVKQ